jgi:hypothetical protein
VYRVEAVSAALILNESNGLFSIVKNFTLQQLGQETGVPESGGHPGCRLEASANIDARLLEPRHNPEEECGTFWRFPP